MIIRKRVGAFNGVRFFGVLNGGLFCQIGSFSGSHGSS